MSRIVSASVASVHPHHVAKRQRKWPTGFDEAELSSHLSAGTTFEDFFAAGHLNPSATLITGVKRDIHVEDVEDPLIQEIRYLNKLVDELAKGMPMAKVLRA